MGLLKEMGSCTRGRRLFLMLIAIVCASIISWASEKIPLLTSSRSVKEHYLVHIPHGGALDDESHGVDEELMKKLVIESTNELLKDEFLGDVGTTKSERTSDRSNNNYKELEPMPLKNNTCNYAKGKWVADNRMPLYSGVKCKRWLSEMWACRLTQRTDFSFEAFRWQPDNCKLPDFEASSFLERMKGKTLAFVGDSLGRQQFQSLMCMVTAGEDDMMQVEDVGEEYGFVLTEGSARPSGWAYRFPRTNTTILYHWSATLCELEPLNISDPLTSFAMHLDRPATFLQQHLHKLDVLVLNTGHHWNRGKLNGNRWEMYAGGFPVKDRHLRMIGNAKNFTVHSVVKWLDKQLPMHPHLKVFLRSISPRHFFNGEWNTGGSCDNTSPLAHGYRVLQDESSDPVSAHAVLETGVFLLDISALSQLRDEAHISKYRIRATSDVHDCLHWCLPGIPDTWNEILAALV